MEVQGPDFWSTSAAKLASAFVAQLMQQGGDKRMHASMGREETERHTQIFLGTVPDGTDKYADIGFIMQLLGDMRSTRGVEPSEVPLYMFVADAEGNLSPFAPFDPDQFFADQEPFAVLLLNPDNPTTRHFDLLWRTEAQSEGNLKYVPSRDTKQGKRRACHFKVEHVRGDGFCGMRVAAAFAHTFGLLTVDVCPPQAEDGQQEETISLQVDSQEHVETQEPDCLQQVPAYYY